MTHYSPDWSTVDGGGGSSTGGVYAVSGTIGQPDAGQMIGGTYTLSGGFWGIITAVQTEGAPLLSVTLNSQLSTITVSWPLPATGWLLHATTNLVTGGSVWTEILQSASRLCVFVVQLGNRCALPSRRLGAYLRGDVRDAGRQ